MPDVIDVWRVDLSRATDDGLTALLSAQERARAARIVHERSRVSWARSRGVLRALLACYLDADPRELRFELGRHGKPALQGCIGQAPDLRFNLSHSGELVLVAMTVGREVGVDVEVARDPPRGRLDELAIAARVLAPEQVRRLEGFGEEERTAQFLRAWTMREATVKCLGTGLAAMPVAGERAPPGLWTAELDVGLRAAAAVAVAGNEDCELRLRDTPPKLGV